MGDALRAQKKDPTKFFLDVNGDGSLTFQSDGWPPLKMKQCSSNATPEPVSPEWLQIAEWQEHLIKSGEIKGKIAVTAAPSGKYCGKVPFIIENTIDIQGGGTANLDINVKVAHQEISCPTEAVSVSDNQVTFPKTASTGDCLGDALRTQKKDPSKFFLDVNGDGSLTFKSDGWPDLKMKSC